MSVKRRDTELKKELLSGVGRLKGALELPLDADYAAHVEKRLKFITSRLDRLAIELHQSILAPTKEHIESKCKDEALKSRLLDQLSSRMAA